MRNLKRALSLVLAVVMVIGLMVVGAGAVSYSDFSDRDEIVNRDAVSMLTTLGVIEGKPDGSYDPNGNVDRAQMAKMISVIMNQGADNSALYVNTPTNLTDVDANWASGHIKYCYTNGIIAGRGNGTFDPDANVTAVEAAKMLLVAAGYDPSIEGLEGTDWALNTNALAARLGIFRNFTKDVTQPLNRDDAALLIYNALDVEMIQQYQNGYALSYADHRTILSAMYGVYKVEGVVIGNQYAMLDGTEYDDATSEGRTVLAAGYRIIASTTSNTMVEDPATERDTTFNVETPVEYLGKTVTMYIEKATILSDSKVLGVELNDEANTIITSVGNESSMKDLLKGTGVSVDRDTEYYVNYGIVADEDAANAIMKVDRKPTVTTNSNGIELEVIDNDNDGTAEYVLWVQEDLTTITSLNESKETIAFAYDNGKDITSYNNGKSIDLEDVTLYDGAEEGDVVLVRTYGGHYYVTQPEVVVGEMERYSNKTINEQWIEVNGTEYRPSFINTSVDGYLEDVHTFVIGDCDETNGVQWDITYNFYLDSNGYVAAFEPTEDVVNNYALVLESGYEPGVIASNASGAVTVLLADGTKGSYSINFSASARNLGEQIEDDANTAYTYSTNMGIAELKGFLGTDYVDNSTTRPWAYATGMFTERAGTRTNYNSDRAAGYVITYSLNENNVLTITSVVGTYASNAIESGATKYSSVLGDAGSNDTFTSVVSPAYSSGRGTVYYDGNNTYGTKTANNQLAIDRDTVAFYYLGDEDNNGTVDDDEYGLAIGYNNMADAPINTQFVAQRVGTTNLADVVLFDCAGPEPDKDYVYILGRNDHSNSGTRVGVYGILEDGTPVNLTITRDNYEEMNLNNDASRYYKVFSYSTNSEGISTLSDPTARVLNGYGLLLENGTVAFDTTHTTADPLTNRDYLAAYAMDDNVKIWNVTDVDEGENAPAGSFTTNRVRSAILILNSSDKIETAFVWTIDDSTPQDPTYDLRVTWDEDTATVRVFNPNGLSDLALMREISSVLEENGLYNANFTGVTFNQSNDVIASSVPVNVGSTNGFATTVDVVREYRVTQDGSNPRYLVSGENYAVTGAVGDTFLINKENNTTAEITLTSASQNYSITGSETNAGTYLIDIKQAYSVATSANMEITDGTNTADDNTTQFWAKGTVLTVVPDANFALDPACDLADLVDANNQFKLDRNITATEAAVVVANLGITYATTGLDAYVNDIRLLPSDVPADNTAGTKVTLPDLSSNTASGYQFAGWMETSGDFYKAGEITLTSSLNLTPIFISTAVVPASSVSATTRLATETWNVATNLTSNAVITSVKADVTIAAGSPITETSTTVAVSGGNITPTFTDSTAFTNIAAGDTVVLTITVTYTDTTTATFTATYSHT